MLVILGCMSTNRTDYFFRFCAKSPPLQFGPLIGRFPKRAECTVFIRGVPTNLAKWFAKSRPIQVFRLGLPPWTDSRKRCARKSTASCFPSGSRPLGRNAWKAFCSRGRSGGNVLASQRTRICVATRQQCSVAACGFFVHYDNENLRYRRSGVHRQFGGRPTDRGRGTRGCVQQSLASALEQVLGCELAGCLSCLVASHVARRPRGRQNADVVQNLCHRGQAQ